MSVDAKCPTYELFEDDWAMLRHCEAGERTVKEQGYTYLPMPSGFTKQSDNGRGMYDAYRLRAQYPEILQPTLQGMVGVIHRVEAQIEGLEEGKPLASMWEKATKDGLTLEAFHRRITTELLLMGRYSVMVDLPLEGGNGIPFFVGYTAEQLINWAEGVDRDFFVLDETHKARQTIQGGDEFSWVDERRYRVLRLKDEVYSVQVFDDTTLDLGSSLIEPKLRGGKSLNEIPLVIVGPRDLAVDPEPAPLIGVARASLAIYRLDADYRHQLFNSGQETFCVIGEVDTLPQVLGSGVTVGIPAGGDAKFVGPSGVGINAHRQAILDERQNAVAAGVKLFDNQNKAESGEALKLRAAAQTATLTTIAQASAACLEKALRYGAMFVGQKPDEIVVKPNLQFIDTKMEPLAATQLVTVWQSGAISKQTLYEDLQRGEIASAERTYEEEEELIKQEAIDNPVVSPVAQMGNEQQIQQQRMNGGGNQNNAPPRAGNSNGSTPPASRFIETGQGIVVQRRGQQ